MTRISCIGIILAAFITTSAARAEEPAPAEALEQKEQTLLQLALENAQLREKLNTAHTTCINAHELRSRVIGRLREIDADVRSQRQIMTDFQGYVSWMSGNITGYAKYIQAGSIAAGFAKILPIPYAGQAGMFAKFVSHFTLSLSAASKSISTYLESSRQFTSRVEAIEKNSSPSYREIAELARFADEQLLNDMTDLQGKLATTSDLSASTLSFMESLNHYVGSGDEYWSKAKSLAKIGDAQKKEKSYLAESIATQKNRALLFNGKFRQFDETVRKDTIRIKGLSAYNELLKELSSRQEPAHQLPTAPVTPQK